MCAMATRDAPKLRCFISVPAGPEYRSVETALRRGAEAAGYLTSSQLESVAGSSLIPTASEELARADCVLADFTGVNPAVVYEVGMARAMGKPLLAFAEKDKAPKLPSELADFRYVTY